jgi:hypothetical protein
MVNFNQTKSDLDAIESKNYNTTKWIAWNPEAQELETHPSLEPTLLDLWPLDNDSALRVLSVSTGSWMWCIDLVKALEECMSVKHGEGRPYNVEFWNERWKEIPELKEDDVWKGIELLEELHESIMSQVDDCLLADHKVPWKVIKFVQRSLMATHSR